MSNAKATVWRVQYSHKHDDGRAAHTALFLTADPSGAGLYEVVRDAVSPECRTDLVISEASRFGDASGTAVLAAATAVVN